jgi:hypothetical protein
MTDLLRVLYRLTFLIGVFMFVDCRTDEQQKELAEIKLFFATSKIKLPDNSLFIGWSMERGYINALLRCQEPIKSLSVSSRENAVFGTYYDVMKARCPTHDLGNVVSGSDRFYEWTNGQDLWYQRNLQTSNGYYTEIEVFLGKAR